MAGSSDAAGTVDVQTVLSAGLGSWTLDAGASSVEFHIKHFWGIMTVNGQFEQLAGGGTIGPDGAISGHLEIEASSLTTKMGKRDEHLRSADFFDVENHPKVLVSADNVTAAGPNTLQARITLEVAGRQQSYETTIDVLEATPEAATLRCELEVDRTAFGMTWSPLGMTAKQARGVVVARFVHQ